MFSIAIQIADGFVRAGVYENVLVVSGETGDAASGAADAIQSVPRKRRRPLWFGDDINNHIRHYAACFTLGSIGAATVVCDSPCEDQACEVLGQSRRTLQTAELCILASPKSPLVVDPPTACWAAAVSPSNRLKTFMRERNNSIDSLEYLFVHQPAKTTVASYAAGFDYPIEKIVETVSRFGNVITCSTLLGWKEVSQGLRSGNLVGANIVGSGISSGSLLLRCV